MKKKLVIGFVFIGLFMSIGLSYGEISLIKNGSFEQNGHVIDDIAIEPPIHWCDVNFSSVQFSAWVGTYGVTQGQYALTLSSNAEDLVAGKEATVSQEMFIESDVSSISFSLQLSSGWPEFFPWSADQRTFFVAIDGQPVWDSDGLEIGPSGEYFDVIEIPEANIIDFCDDSRHEISLGLRVNQSGIADVEYYVDVDFVKFDKYCGGLGYLDEDLNLDCYVDEMDLMLLAEDWLKPVVFERFDLYEDGSVNFFDVAVLAQSWLFNSDWTKWGQEGTWQMELLDLDLDLSGQIDPCDLQIFCENWLQEPPPCSLIDQYPDEDEIINFRDFAVFAQQWGYKDWIYYLD